MPNFIEDQTRLPTGTQFASAATNTATTAMWNQVVQALLDTRFALLVTRSSVSNLKTIQAPYVSYPVVDGFGVVSSTVNTFSGGSSIINLALQGAFDFVIEGTPSFSSGIADGQEMSIRAETNQVIILKDESILPNSKLRLSTPYAYISGYAVIKFRWDGSYWTELWRSVGVTDGSTLGNPIHDSTGTPGSAIQNAQMGRVSLAPGESTLIVSNSKVTSFSIITANLQSDDVTCKYIESVVPATGSFTIKCNANATATTNICWKLHT